MATSTCSTESSPQEETIGQLKIERAILNHEIEVLKHKGSTQTGQVIGCENKVRKVRKELVEARDKEVHLQHQIEKLQTSCDILKRTNDTLKIQTQSRALQYAQHEKHANNPPDGQAHSPACQLPLRGKHNMDASQDSAEDKVMAQAGVAKLLPPFQYNDSSKGPVLKVQVEENKGFYTISKGQNAVSQAIKQKHTHLEPSASKEQSLGSSRKRRYLSPINGGEYVTISDDQAKDWLDTHIL